MLDAGCQASPGMWYLLAAAGDGPCPRVGHACCLTSYSIQHENTEDEAQPTSQQKQQGLVIVGGATPAGPFGDFYILELCKLGLVLCFKKCCHFLNASAEVDFQRVLHDCNR